MAQHQQYQQLSMVARSNVNDPQQQPPADGHQAMAADAATRSESQATFMSTVEVPSIEDVPDEDVSLDLSESPPDNTSKKQKVNARPPAGRRVLSLEHTRKRMGHGRAASADGGKARAAPRGTAPAPVVADIGDHILVAPTGNSPDEQLAALVQQQQVDHKYFTALKDIVQAAMGTLIHYANKHDEIAESLKQSNNVNLQLRREIFAVRDDAKQETQRLGHIVETEVVPNIERKIIAIETNLAGLQTTSAASLERELKMANYLNNLDGERPQEGNEVIHGFMHVTQAIKSVNERVQQFEAMTANGTPVATNGNQGIHVTAKMMTRLDEMHAKVEILDNFYIHYNAMLNRVNEHAASLSQIDAQLGQINLTILENSDANNLQCGQCGGGDVRPFVPGVPAHEGACGQHHGGAGEGGAGGDGGSSGDRMGKIHQNLQAIMGGNNLCHCVHVSELIKDVSNLKGLVKDSESDPWARGFRKGTRDGADHHGDRAQHAETARDVPPRGPGRVRRALPLHLPGPMGAVNFKDRSLFDDKLTLNEEYRYNGVKNGMQWKNKLECYFVAKAPILKEVLEWAEAEDAEAISVEKFKMAVSNRMTEEQALTVNAAIWGFLSGCLHGSAMTMFKRAEMLNGIDAWRCMVRQVDHGIPIRLETLRREVKEMHNKPIRSLEQVEEGVAEFENTMQEYVRAGGHEQPDHELKSDLLRILPKEIRELLLWHSTNVGVSFQQFRDTIVAQTAQVLMNRGTQRSVHSVEQRQAECRDAVMRLINGGNENGDEGSSEKDQGLDEFIAAINRMRGQPGGRPAVTRPRTDLAVQRGPRKCANCGQEHAERKCPHPPVPVGDRLCWFCKGKGHTSRDCEKRKKAGAIKNVEPGPEPGVLFTVGEDGFQKVRNGVKPRPHRVTLNDYMSRNYFEVLKTSEKKGRACTGSSAQVPAQSVAAKQKNKVSPVQSVESGGKGNIPESMSVMEFDEMLKKELKNAEAVIAEEHRVQCLTHDVEDDDIIAAATEEVTISVAVDSGSVENVIHPDELPSGVVGEPNTTNRHFVGANNSRIENFGHCTTHLTGKASRTPVQCGWTLADVSRPLHAVCKLTGTVDKPKQDVLFNAGKCVVVPPGIVDGILKTVKPLMQYDRKGELYVAEMTMSSFGRQGASA